MKIASKSILILVLTCVVAACADDCAPPAMQEPHATLVIYRLRNNIGGFRQASIYVDEQKVCSLANGRYLIVRIPPGQHKIRSSDSTHFTEQSFNAGLTYYFLVRVIPNGKQTRELRDFWSLEPVPTFQAEPVVKLLKPQNGRPTPLPTRFN